MPPVAPANKTYWRSLEDLADTPEFREMVENEFPSRVGELVDPLSRRRFLKVMGASLALAGLTGCDGVNIGWTPRWPKEHILPFAKRPEGRNPGTPVHYATCVEQGGVARPLLVKSSDGRPIKVEGNPDHPSSRSWSGTDCQSQASVLSMYDPDRTKAVHKKGADGLEESSWEAFLAAWAATRGKLQNGRGLWVVAPAGDSPSLGALKKRMETALGPEMRWIQHEAISDDAARQGSRIAFSAGKDSDEAYRSYYHLEPGKARVVVSLDADLLMSGPNATAYAKAFMDSRRANKSAAELEMNRLYVAEGVLSVTGTQADQRLPVAPSRVPLLALDLADRLAKGDESLFSEELRGKLSTAREQIGEYLGYETNPPELNAFLTDVAADLLANRGRSLIVAGERQAPEVHALAALLNEALGNAGKTVTYAKEPLTSRRYAPRAHEIKTLAEGLGEAQAIVFLGTNPVYDAPADLGLRTKLAGSKAFKVHLGLHADETALACDWHLPMAHYLESWGDACGWDGTLTLQQPLISPLYGGRSPIELLALLSGTKPANGYDIVRATAMEKLGQSGDAFEVTWRQGLHDGYLNVSLVEAASPTGRRGPVLEQFQKLVEARKPAPQRDTLELVLNADHKLHDGRHANNAWLQETPDPITKLTWDNALLMSPYTAAQLELDPAKANEVELSVAGGQATVGVHLVPGMAPFTVALALGYGRTAAGAVGLGSGVDAYTLRTSDELHLRSGAKVKATGGIFRLATTQDHHSIDTWLGREEIQRRLETPEKAGEEPASAWLLRETTLTEYKERPRFAQVVVGPDPEKTQLWDSPVPYAESAHRWALSIDLNACTGCSACVTACMAENNIPVVGKQEVARGREMHWIRIDRYFKGDPELDEPYPHDEPGAKPAQPMQVLHQPVPCMQCENAPCESVCPVAATTHSREGLNDMVYNRCIGTRYCSNNCPYKVRRFNYFFNHYGPFHPRSQPRKEGLLADETPQPPELTPEPDDVSNMVYNPEVTLRARGVMEKCTYCVQRIKAVTIPARNERRAVKDGEIQTACQQACPTRAIVFGDLNDPASEVSQLHGHERTYGMLAELNTRPRTRYMAKLRNPRQEASE